MRVEFAGNERRDLSFVGFLKKKLNKVYKSSKHDIMQTQKHGTGYRLTRQYPDTESLGTKIGVTDHGKTTQHNHQRCKRRDIR